MDLSRARRLVAPPTVAGLVLVAALAGAPAVHAEETAFTVSGPALANPVGMATDHVNRRYWVVQGTSGTLTLQALDEKGARLGTVSSRDRITNVQALAMNAQMLFIGDVGGSRERVTVYLMDRPLPGTEINRSITLALSYPDGAHDAAAIMVDANDRVFVVTKGKNSGIYAAPEDPQLQQPWVSAAPPVNKLTRVADAPADVTDATVLVDGRIALRSAAEGVQVLDASSFAVVGTQAVEANQKGATLTQSLDQQSLLAGAGADGSFVSVAVPGPAPARPTAAATKRPAEPAAADQSDPEANRSFEQTGTTVAVVAAAAVSLLAAAVVLLKR